MTPTESERAYEIVKEFVAWTPDIGPCPITPLNKPWFKRLCAMAERMAILEQEVAIRAPEPNCEHCESGERCKGFCKQAARIDAIYDALIDRIGLQSEEYCRNLSIAAAGVLEPEIKGLEGLIRAIVATAGGVVEGQPTADHNILQRIRALRELERWVDEPIDEAGHG